MSRFNRKITKNKTDHLIVKNELNKLKTFDTIMVKVILQKVKNQII